MRKYSGLLLPFLFVCSAGAQSFRDGQAARAVIGQNYFTASSSSAGQNILGGASGLAYANGMLWVADSNRIAATPQDNRVLMFPTAQIAGLHDDITSGGSECRLCGYPASIVLGQVDFASSNPGRSQQGTSNSSGNTGSMSTPTAVATDGNILAVADTDNNRILIWKSIPTVINQPADLVLGQPDFTTFQQPQSVTASALRGPQGVWINNGKLFVADTQNYRILVWNKIPTQNNQPADLVLGQPNFTSGTQAACNPTKSTITAAANELCNPVSVTTDPAGAHLFVSDLGFNRVLIWNSIPTSMNQPADLAVGQPDLTSAAANNSSGVCPSNGTDSNGHPTYPPQCQATLNFPRFALSDGTKLFIADGGNDRILVFNSIPKSNGAQADNVLGQPNSTSNSVVTSQSQSIASTTIDNTAAVDIIPTPMSLAYDGVNLYASDPTNNRILIYTPGDTPLGSYSVVNWASEVVRQEGIIVLTGSIVANDTVTITIQSTNYTYTVKSTDTLDSVAKGLVSAINANSGDPNATAIFGGSGTATVYLSSKGINLAYDSISLSATSSNTSDITATASGAYLSAGTAGIGAPGMLVAVNGTNLSDVTSPVTTPLNGNSLPTSLGGAEVFMDGFAEPLLSVSSTQIVTQVPYEFVNRNSISIYVRTVHNNGSVTVTNATPIYIASANPGIFNAPAYPGQSRPWPIAFATHQSGNATSVVSIDGTAHAGDTATITISGTNYTYTVQSNDTLSSIVNGLVSKINGAPDPYVTATAGGSFTRVVLTAIQSGAPGNGVSIAGSASSNAQVTVTAYTSSTCCNVPSNAPITQGNPAVPGELINVVTAGIGTLQDSSNTAQNYQITGQPYTGPQISDAVQSVSATMGGSTAEVINVTQPTGSYGMYDVQLIVPSSLSNNNATQLYIAQNAFISNTVTVPVGPANPVLTASPSPINVNIDSPSPGQSFSGLAHFGGWAVYQNTSVAITGVNISVDGVSYGAATYGGNRQDVCNANPNASGCPNVGWDFNLDTTLLANGNHIAQATATGADGLHFTVSSPFVVGNSSSNSVPQLFIDQPGPQSGRVQGLITISGWAVSQSAAISSVVVTVDGATVGNATYGASRPDVCNVYTGWSECPNVGWSYLLNTTTLANGAHTLGIVATGNGQHAATSTTFTVSNWTGANPTNIDIDTPSTSSGPFSGTASFGGWALNDFAAIASVTYSVDGISLGNASYGGVRQDVCNANPGRAGCPNVGWNLALDTTQFADGTHTLAITATPAGGVPSTVSRTFTIANTSPTKVLIDTPNNQSGAVSGTVNVAGWAISTASGGAITSVQILVDGVSYGTATYGSTSRPDVCRYYSLSGSASGCPMVGWSFALNTVVLTNGSHILEARAASNTGQTATSSSSFTVTNSLPNGPVRLFIDQPNGQSNPFLGLAVFSGWAVDDNTAISKVTITVDGVPNGTATYGVSRPDVCNVYPGRSGCPNVGWSFVLDTTMLADGGHSLGVTATAADGGVFTASANFVVANWSTPDPMTVTIDNPSSSSTLFGTVGIGGWAIDQNAPISSVQVSVDGIPVGTASYGGVRNDVCSGHPNISTCPNVGWNYGLVTTLFANGPHTLGITATTSNGQSTTATVNFTIAN